MGLDVSTVGVLAIEETSGPNSSLDFSRSEASTEPLNAAHLQRCARRAKHAWHNLCSLRTTRLLHASVPALESDSDEVSLTSVADTHPNAKVDAGADADLCGLWSALWTVCRGGENKIRIGRLRSCKGLVWRRALASALVDSSSVSLKRFTSTHGGGH